MRFHGLDLNLLVALDALLTHQNVTRAAEQLNLSQSALSGALARLREHFDDELVVPIGRRMEPTPLARTLAEPLHDILLKTKSLVTTTAKLRPADVEPSHQHHRLGLLDRGVHARSVDRHRARGAGRESHARRSIPPKRSSASTAEKSTCGSSRSALPSRAIRTSACSTRNMSASPGRTTS